MVSARKTPTLSRADEREVADKAKAGCAKSRDLLVRSHLRLVIRIARGHSGYGLPLDDMIQAGNIGLMKAVDNFDPARGFRFMTCATLWVKEEIRRFIMRNFLPVNVAHSDTPRMLFFALKPTLARLGLGATREDVARELGCDVRDVDEMAGRLADRAASLDHKPDDGLALHEILPDHRQTPEEQVVEQFERAHDEARIAYALACLSEQERFVVMRRKMAAEPHTLHEIGEMIGRSYTTVSNIERRAMDKLRKLLAA